MGLTPAGTGWLALTTREPIGVVVTISAFCYPRIGVSNAFAPTAEHNRQMVFPRITARADQMGGVPCIRGLRIPVATVVGMIADGMAEGEILQAYPDLESEDLRESLRYAAEAVRERELPLNAGE